MPEMEERDRMLGTVMDFIFVLCILKTVFNLITGSVLVFLPGYDEIITLRDTLAAHREFGNSRRYTTAYCFLPS